jgi:hypothetical protein
MDWHAVFWANVPVTTGTVLLSLTGVAVSTARSGPGPVGRDRDR